jgi:hypothetical protein
MRSKTICIARWRSFLRERVRRIDSLHMIFVLSKPGRDKADVFGERNTES